MVRWRHADFGEVRSAQAPVAPRLAQSRANYPQLRPPPPPVGRQPASPRPRHPACSLIAAISSPSKYSESSIASHENQRGQVLVLCWFPVNPTSPVEAQPQSPRTDDVETSASAGPQAPVTGGASGATHSCARFSRPPSWDGTEWRRPRRSRQRRCQVHPRASSRRHRRRRCGEAP